MSSEERNPRWVAVGRTAEFSPGQVYRVKAEGRVLALVNHEGCFYAFDAVCPHRGGPLDQGEIWRGTLECPWHRHRYDLASGANVYPRNVYPDDLPELQAELQPARTFRVKVMDGLIYVQLEPVVD